MQDVYFISGMGADERLLQYLDIPEIRIHYIHWITPEKNESWNSYTKRLLEQIHHPNPILIGISMGGMIAIEMNKHISVAKTILISSAKTYHEIPFYFRLLKYVKIHHWLGYKLLTKLGLLAGNWLFGTRSKAESKLLKEIIYDIDETYFRWAWHRVACWKNEFIPEKITHIHGNKDHMLPIYNVHADITIKGGTHLMVLNKAEEISAILTKLIYRHEPTQ